MAAYFLTTPSKNSLQLRKVEKYNTIKTLKLTCPYNNEYINANGNGSFFGMEERTYLVFV